MPSTRDIREQTQPDVIVATKLQVPRSPRKPVAREALVRALANAESRLTLVAAPAGWGKTTAFATWYGASFESRRFAWLSLDAEDNDPAHFWDCVIAALRTV